MGNKGKHSILRHEKDEITSKISTYLLKHHKKIYTAYLFGSFITKETFGDIDLGILIKYNPENPLEYEIELENQLEKFVKLPIDVRILNNAPISFTQKVIRDGLVLVNSEPNRRSDFENYILKKYFDFERFRRRYLSEVTNAPV